MTNLKFYGAELTERNYKAATKEQTRERNPSVERADNIAENKRNLDITKCLNFQKRSVNTDVESKQRITNVGYNWNINHTTLPLDVIIFIMSE